ncbi:partial Chemotaxis protein methyltransferase, partial [Candidatus Brocadiaceae bacterium]
MSITIQYTEQLCKVAILGQLEKDSDKQQLLTLLKSPKFILELDFYDAELLPVDVLIAVSDALEIGIPIKLVIYRELLAHTLARLNIPFRKVLSQPLIDKSLTDCRAIVLAGSARSLDKIMHIISCLPDADISVFIIQHIREDQTNLLDKLLKVITNYRVMMPHHLMPVETGVIYIAPPAHHLHVAHGLIYLTRDKKIQFARPSIDVLFESIAYEYGNNALAALLCGFGQDGVQGCAILKEKGALVLLEKSEECEDAVFLLNKVKSAGYFHHILSCDAIASVVSATAIGEKAEPSGQLQQLFLTAIKTTYGYDLLGYQRDSIERRIKSIMLSFGTHYFADFQRLILGDAKLFQRFIIEISVGVSHFFRHTEQMCVLRNEILPYLASFPLIKIWSAGCSTGEEAYSLAILLHELGLLNKSRVFATDINPYLLELAK